NVYINRLLLAGKKYDSAAKAGSFLEVAGARIAALPDVQSVAFSNGLPMVGGEGLLFRVDGTPEVPVKDMPHTSDHAVTPDYFQTMGIPLRRGRVFTAEDKAGAPRVVIINEELARRHFPGVDPVGRRLMIAKMDDTPDVLREIVGVVGDVRLNGPQNEIQSQVYEPFAQRPSPGFNLIVKAKSPAPWVMAAVAEIVRALDPDLPFRNMRRYDDALAASWFRQRFSMILFTVFSGIALLLAAIGIYGVMAYAVSQRTPEIGVRMALGASAQDVQRLVLGGAARMVALGLLLGVAGALAFARGLQALLFRTSPADPLTLLAAAGVLVVVAFLACWLPARRAAKVDPIVALRAE
ncbi:MAG: FtsX-like permease family protein, partial [Opitutaceae bacterium]